MPFQNHSKDTVIRGQEGTLLYKESLKDKCSGKDIRFNWNATRE
jgi:hypothetical protein